MPKQISRAAYADMYGPTTGDKIRLADTELFIEVEQDCTTYGEEVKFGIFHCVRVHHELRARWRRLRYSGRALKNSLAIPFGDGRKQFRPIITRGPGQ